MNQDFRIFFFKEELWIDRILFGSGFSRRFWWRRGCCFLRFFLSLWVWRGLFLCSIWLIFSSQFFAGQGSVRRLRSGRLWSGIFLARATSWLSGFHDRCFPFWLSLQQDAEALVRCAWWIRRDFDYRRPGFLSDCRSSHGFFEGCALLCVPLLHFLRRRLRHRFLCFKKCSLNSNRITQKQITSLFISLYKLLFIIIKSHA